MLKAKALRYAIYWKINRSILGLYINCITVVTSTQFLVFDRHALQIWVDVSVGYYFHLFH